MCRACSDGGRRCPNDTSLARRARRYAAAGKQDPRIAASVRGTPPSVAGGNEPSAGHDLSTAEGIRDRAAELRDAQRQAGEALMECMERYKEQGELSREDAEAIVSKYEHAAGLVTYKETGVGPVLPVISMESYERESTALGQKADQWLDGELTEQHQACEDAASAYATARERYENDREAGRAEWDAREEARVQLMKTREAYFERKRELMGQFRENGQELEWTTAGTSTPARVNETIQASATFFPKDWIEASNTQAADKTSTVRPVRVRESTSRNHYSPHKHITRRETRVKESFYSKDLAEKIDVYNSPRYKVVPEDEWTGDQRNFYPGEVLVREYDIARTGSYFDSSPGAGAVDEDGNFLLTGRAASGWEKHTYTDHHGEEQTCWRKPATRTTTNRKYGVAELTIPKDTGRKGQMNTTATHELTHRCEQVNSTIPTLERQFLIRRTTNTEGERDKLEPYYPHTRGEYVRPDDFIDRYVGKDYPGGTFHEVLSVGNEAAFHGSHGGFGKVPDVNRGPETPVRRDDDHHAFVLGTYMTA